MGISEQSPLAGTYCGDDIPEPISSVTGFYIVFNTDSTSSGLGFNISYERSSGQPRPIPQHLILQLPECSVTELCFSSFFS